MILNLAMVLCIFGKKKEGNIDCLGDRVRLISLSFSDIGP